jgi:hypothetical protein
MPKTATPAKTRTAARPKPARRSIRKRSATAAPVAVTHEQIAARAYELHLAGAGGDPLEHWLRAERELVGA